MSLNTMQCFKVDVRFYGEHNHSMRCVTPRPTYFKPPGLSAWTSLVFFLLGLPTAFSMAKISGLILYCFWSSVAKNTKFITYSQNVRADASASFSKRLGSNPIVVVKPPAIELSNWGTVSFVPYSNINIIRPNNKQQRTTLHKVRKCYKCLSSATGNDLYNFFLFLGSKLA